MRRIEGLAIAIRERYDAERNVLFIAADGPLTDEDLVKYAQQATVAPAARPGRHELLDLRALSDADVSTATLRRVADMFATTERTPEQSRVAIVANEALAYGLSRMYQAFRSDSPLQLRVFREMGEARRWLELPPE